MRSARLTVFSASPHKGGTCDRLSCHVASLLESAGAQVRTVRLSEHDVAGCTGCGACARTGSCVLRGPSAVSASGTLSRPGFEQLYEAIDGADGLVVVAPVYFAGPPSQLKAFIDRLQFLWARRYVLGASSPLPYDLRRPFDLVVVGGGGDPFGFEPLVACVRSGLRMMDYEMRRLCDLTGQPTEPEALAKVVCGDIGDSLEDLARSVATFERAR